MRQLLAPLAAATLVFSGGCKKTPDFSTCRGKQEAVLAIEAKLDEVLDDSSAIREKQMMVAKRVQECRCAASLFQEMADLRAEMLAQECEAGNSSSVDEVVRRAGYKIEDVCSFCVAK